jgi:hypothetical protein
MVISPLLEYIVQYYQLHLVNMHSSYTSQVHREFYEVQSTNTLNLFNRQKIDNIRNVKSGTSTLYSQSEKDVKFRKTKHYLDLFLNDYLLPTK